MKKEIDDPDYSYDAFVIIRDFKSNHSIISVTNRDIDTFINQLKQIRKKYSQKE